MSLEKGINQRLQVGDGGALVIAGTVFAVVATGTKITDTGDEMAAVEVGMRVDITGFSTNPATMEAYVSAKAANEITITNVFDGFGEEVTLQDEAAGASISLTFTKFNRISEEQTLSFDVTPETEETGSKERNGQSRVSIVSHAVSFQCAGKADFPDTNGLLRVKRAVDKDQEVICRIEENSQGDIWEGPFALTFSESSSQSENTGYNISGASAGLIKFMETGSP